MTIQMNDFLREPPAMRQLEKDAAARVIDSGWYVLGKEVEAFETKWANYCGAKHAIGVANGMDAIEIGLRALDIGPGDEVVTTPMTAFATVLAILRTGAHPVLADITLDHGQITASSIARCVSHKTKAVLLVHLFGYVQDLEDILTLCRSKNLHFLEDCAQAHCAKWRGKAVGTVGAFGAYSFYPTKNLGAVGDAGAIVTDDKNIAQKCMQLRNYGQSVRYFHPLLGLNSRLDELQAAILCAKLEWLNEFTTLRRRIAETYRQGLRSDFVSTLRQTGPTEGNVHHLFPLYTKWRDQMISHLQSAGIQSHIHYPVPVHMQESVKGIAYDPAGLHQAEAFAKSIFSIPCHPYLSVSEIDKIVSAVNSFRPTGAHAH